MTDDLPPTVGVASNEYRAVCVYSHRPGDPQCGTPATVHVLTDCVEYGAVGLAACDAHSEVARRAGIFLAEHPHAGFCGLPGTIWHTERNVCILDDSGVEPVLSLADDALPYADHPDYREAWRP